MPIAPATRRRSSRRIGCSRMVRTGIPLGAGMLMEDTRSKHIVNTVWWWLVPVVIFALLAPAAARAQWTEEVIVPRAAFAHPNAPSAVVHAPRGFDPTRPFDVVVFLHGWTGCARVLARPGRVACREGEPARDGWGLTERHDESGVVQSV